VNVGTNKPAKPDKWGFRQMTLAKIEEGYCTLEFTPPLVVEYYVAANDTLVHVSYDFGMGCYVPTNPEKNFLLRKLGKMKETSNVAQAIFRTVCFDLFHAFCHFQGDPNYSCLHWALYGNLKDRTKVVEKWPKTRSKP
jgi:hypothetical protein